MFATIGAMVMVIAAVGGVYWRYRQNQMRDQVRGILAQYMILEDATMESDWMQGGGDSGFKPMGDDGDGRVMGC
jgi:hypothetical protein